jgi:sugar lactone lactonase YvrE
MKGAFELSVKLDWLNADPQMLSAHHGRIVALLFWNASSVYCHNALSDMFQLQRRHPENLSVLAIHVPKYTAEQDQKTLLDVINRLDIQLPVANDTRWTAWQHYDIQSWPSVVLIDPAGSIVATFAGDENRRDIESKINELLAGMPYATNPKPKLLKARPKPKVFSPLHSPCGLLIHNKLLYIADSGHNRILECTFDGQVKRVFGNGLPLYLDGIASEASFNRPMGMSAAREFLYVADTGNHAIRRVRLLDGYIDTLLGNGKPGRTDDRTVATHHNVQLDNPTAVSVWQDLLVVADAGNNSLRMYNLANGMFSSLAGSGALALVDGIGARAEMAHPLSLSGSRNYLYIAEGSSSSIRTTAVPEGRVNTLVGHGLYHFGREDGLRKTAALQHPSAVVADEKRGMLWIADAYNHKIRTFNLASSVLSTVTISQAFGYPSALAIDGESLWIADSASSQIHRYFFDTEYLSRISIQMP